MAKLHTLLVVFTTMVCFLFSVILPAPVFVGIRGGCSDHGFYLPDEEACACDEGYAGRLCNTNIMCQPGGVWREEQNSCECALGYVGNLCDRCVANSVCAPTMHPEHLFTLVIVQDGFRSKLLSDGMLVYPYMSILPGSTYLGVRYGCDCRPQPDTDELKKASYYLLNDAGDTYYRPWEKIQYPNDTAYLAYFDVHVDDGIIPVVPFTLIYVLVIVCAIAAYSIVRSCLKKKKTTKDPDNHENTDTLVLP